MSPLHIVLIENNPADAKWFQLTLKQCLSDTELTVYSGEEAALAALWHAPSTDLLAVNWYMPKLEGRELLDKVREIPALAHTPIAVFAPEYEQAKLSREWYGGRLHIVTKPIACDQLTAILKTLGGTSTTA